MSFGDDTLNPSNKPPDEDISVRVLQYRKVRDKIAEIKERQEKELAPAKAVLEQLSGMLDAFLLRTGQTSAATKSGTFFRSTRFTATVNDPQAFMDHVIANQQWDLIERRANSTAVKGFVEDKKHDVPGVTLNAITSVSVRAPTAKAKSTGETK